MSEETTTIEVSNQVADKLHNMKQRKEAYNDVLIKLINEHEYLEDYLVKDELTLDKMMKEVNKTWGRTP